MGFIHRALPYAFAIAPLGHQNYFSISNNFAKKQSLWL
jgi:hypothetical protein